MGTSSCDTSRHNLSDLRSRLLRHAKNDGDSGFGERMFSRSVTPDDYVRMGDAVRDNLDDIRHTLLYYSISGIASLESSQEPQVRSEFVLTLTSGMP